MFKRYMRMCMRLWRMTKTLYHKFKRTRGTPYSVAMGVAVGLFVGIAVPIGLQVPGSILMAFAFRCNKLIAFFGTFVSNAYTVPIIYPLLCLLGARILGVDVTLSSMNKDIMALIKTPSWSGLLEFGDELLWSFLVGGVIVGVISGVIGYYLTYWLVVRHRAKVQIKMDKARARLGVASVGGSVLPVL